MDIARAKKATAEKNLEREMEMERLGIKCEVDVDENEVGESSSSHGPGFTAASAEDVNIVASHVTTLVQTGRTWSHMQPVVRLEEMDDLNDYLDQARVGADRAKSFHVKLNLDEEDDTHEDPMDDEYVTTPYDVTPSHATSRRIKSRPPKGKGKSSYAHKKLPPEVAVKWAETTKDENGKYSCFLCSLEFDFHCR